MHDCGHKFMENLSEGRGNDNSIAIDNGVVKPIINLDRERYDVIIEIMGFMKLWDVFQFEVDAFLINIKNEVLDESQAVFMKELRKEITCEIERIYIRNIDNLFNDDELHILLNHCEKHKDTISKEINLLSSPKIQNTTASIVSQIQMNSTDDFLYQPY